MSVEVLVVDEDRDVLEIVGTFLAREDGFEVTMEADPEQALEMVLSGEYDAVVSDYKMPRLDGIELCTAIRERDEGVPFLLFSAREPEDVRPEAADAGVTAFVQKGTGTEQYDVLAERIRESV
ncbi:response regulator [Haloarcula nitratireducens]|uniref:Response regulator n=1 Tax=Haloarcula nitratireducens TaxID=2487749 RepID=A0AAW4PAX7_9EURY|nr:response regulator [Halomicroarcula nitratireducens]MBX0294748.1 response regulator [Halomicroarcula nitratireducens]